ncbi:MAG: hypothetical protein WDM90_21950 [Ferruginibacter sp.]
MEDYWSFVNMVLSHTNKLTGKKYNNEPGIMAWEIANEPRPMRPYAIEGYKNFLLKTSADDKKLDGQPLTHFRRGRLYGYRKHSPYLKQFIR